MIVQLPSRVRELQRPGQHHDHRALSRHRGRVAVMLVVPALALALAACSSSGPTSTPSTTATTQPASKPASPTDVKQFFATRGAPLLAFERATASAVTGKRPPRALYVRLERDAVPTTAEQRRRFSQLTAEIPGAELRDAFRADLIHRFFLLEACVSATGLSDTPDEQRVFESYQKGARAVITQLARVGVTL